jgi:hypothetical protein
MIFSQELNVNVENPKEVVIVKEEFDRSSTEVKGKADEKELV